MQRWTLRLGLSLMVVVSCWTNGLPAQEVFVVPTVPYEPAHHPDYPPPLYPRQQPDPAKHLPIRVLNHFDLACKYDSWDATGTFHSEMRWLFGSSRSFFGDRCFPCQPCAERREQRLSGEGYVIPR